MLVTALAITCVRNAISLLFYSIPSAGAVAEVLPPAAKRECERLYHSYPLTLSVPVAALSRRWQICLSKRKWYERGDTARWRWAEEFYIKFIVESV